MNDVRFESKADDVLSEVSNVRQKTLEAIGLKAIGYAQLLCAVDTGRLRNSLTFVTATARGDANTQNGESASAEDYSPHGLPDEDAVVIGTNVEYAPYVEMGTSKTKAQPFLAPAIENHIKEYEDIAERFMKDTTS